MGDEQDASHQETGDGNEISPENVDGQEHENEHGQGQGQAVQGEPDQVISTVDPDSRPSHDLS